MKTWTTNVLNWGFGFPQMNQRVTNPCLTDMDHKTYLTGACDFETSFIRKGIWTAQTDIFWSSIAPGRDIPLFKERHTAL